MENSLRFPIGQFTAKKKPTEEQRTHFIKAINEIPNKLRQAVAGLLVGTIENSLSP